MGGSVGLQGQHKENIVLVINGEQKVFVGAWPCGSRRVFPPYLGTNTYSFLLIELNYVESSPVGSSLHHTVPKFLPSFFTSLVFFITNSPYCSIICFTHLLSKTTILIVAHAWSSRSNSTFLTLSEFSMVGNTSHQQSPQLSSCCCKQLNQIKIDQVVGRSKSREFDLLDAKIGPDL